MDLEGSVWEFWGIGWARTYTGEETGPLKKGGESVCVALYRTAVMRGRIEHQRRRQRNVTSVNRPGGVARGERSKGKKRHIPRHFAECRNGRHDIERGRGLGGDASLPGGASSNSRS